MKDQVTTQTTQTTETKKPNIIRRLYDWVLHWAHTPWGAAALFVIAFAESSFFPIPPDVLLIALCLGAATKSFRYAAICTVGSVLGGMAGYAIGFYVWEGVQDWFIPGVFSQELFDTVSNLFKDNTFWAVFTAGFTPIPFKVFTIVGGVCSVDFGTFTTAALISRGLRFFLIAGLIWKFGTPIKKFIDKYFNLLALVFTVILIGSFVLIKYLI